MTTSPTPSDQSSPQAYFGFQREEILPHIIRPPVHVLEVGCGQGLFGQSLINLYSCTVLGIEPDVSSAISAQARLSSVINSTVEDALPSLPEAYFDAIFLNDVLEHLLHPAQVLSRLKHALAPEGLIYASIPNILHYQVIINLLARRDFVYESAGILDYTHLRWFTKKGMLRLFDDANLSIVSQVGLDPTPSKLQRLISLLSFGYYEETKYPQFLTIGRH